MYDSEDYHQGRAAAYHTAIGLVRRAHRLSEVLTLLEELEIEATAMASAHARAVPMRVADGGVDGVQIAHAGGRHVGVQDNDAGHLSG